MRCARHAKKTAMLAPGPNGFTALTYADLQDTVHQYAGAIDSLGLKKGDRLVILSENCPEWAFADWACQTLGIVVVPIYPTLPADQAQYIVTDCGASVVLAGDPSQAKKVEDMAAVRTMLLKGESSLDVIARTKEHTIDQAEWERAPPRSNPTMSPPLSTRAAPPVFRKAPCLPTKGF